MMSPGIAEQARAALRRHVIEPLVPRLMDLEYGGFLVDFDERWQPAGPHEKTLEHASRTVIAFALMARDFPDQKCELLVRHGCAFLQQCLWDAKYGGFYAKVDRAGRPCWDGLKHPHAVTYSAQAFLLAEPCLPPGEGRLWASRALAWLNDVAWDPSRGGYWGSFHRNNERYPSGAHLPTPGGGPAITALLGNNSQVTAVSFAGASSHIRSGKARALACFGEQRVAAFPDVPTAKEQGWDVEFYMWVGLFAPKATPAPVVARLRAETGKAVESLPFKQAMHNLNQDVSYQDQPAFKAFLESDSKRVIQAVRLIGKV